MMVFHELSTTGNGVYSLTLATIWFGLSWAWASWWGVAFVVVSGILYGLLVVLVQARPRL